VTPATGSPTIRHHHGHANTALARSVLRYAFHCERPEGRVLVADLLLRIASDVPPRLDFVHVLELENDDTVRWGLASYRKGLIEPASDVFAPIVIDGLLRGWEEVFFVTLLVLDRDFSNDIGATLSSICRHRETPRFGSFCGWQDIGLPHERRPVRRNRALRFIRRKRLCG
jgi:hypothetical protein